MTKYALMAVLALAIAAPSFAHAEEAAAPGVEKTKPMKHRKKAHKHMQKMQKDATEAATKDATAPAYNR